jgi:DNA-binding transcriptional ArsR family regulator
MGVGERFSYSQIVSYVRFDVADLAEIRFGISPISETVTSLWALNDPARHAIHLPWIKQARTLLSQVDLSLLTAFIGGKRWIPDFLCPRPASPLMHIDDDLGTLLATPPERVTADILDLARNQPLRPAARRIADDPVTMLPRLADTIRAWFDVAIAPHWPRMRALLEADIAYRARQLADGGPRLLFETLHPRAHWADDRLVVTDRWDIEVAVGGRGFAMMPSAFADRMPLLQVSSWSPPCVAYPVRALGTLWEGRPTRPNGSLDAILGSARARLLALLATPSTTSDLAARTGLSPGAVSQHLTALHASGLLTRNRQGKLVFYATTDLGSSLLNANMLP